jgi:membrane protease YdiL (CAAX protease family)
MQRVDFVDEREPEGRLHWAWIVAGVVVMATAVFFQWFLNTLRDRTFSEAPAAVRDSESLDGVRHGEMAMLAREYLKLREAYPPEEGFEEEETPAEFFVVAIEPLAVSRTQRLWAAIVAGHTHGVGEALSRLRSLTGDLDPGGALSADAAWLIRLYERGAGSLPEEARCSLVDRHGWFGELALATGEPADGPHRRRALGGGAEVLGVYSGLGVAASVTVLGGLVAMVFFARKLNGRDYDLSPQVSPAQEFLHAFILLVGMFALFLGLSVLPFGLGVEGTVGAVVLDFALPWLLLATIAWPLIRGVRWASLAKHVGLHGGAGAPAEALAGVLGWLAWMPLTIVVGIAIAFFAAEAESAAGHPMMQPPPTDSDLVVWLWVLGSVVWAPVVEEYAFRGLLYGYLRARAGVLLSVLVSSVVFGLVHPYSPLGMAQVAIGGVMLALLREWRGSLIAPMVAHALHNGSLVAVELAVTRLALGG